jgi:hypothetical protein
MSEFFFLLILLTVVLSRSEDGLDSASAAKTASF